MVEREMQELLWRYPERFLNEPLQQFAWETSSSVGRADLVFEDRHGRLLIIEVKRGKLPRGAIDQLLDYFGMMKHKFPDKAVELMVVANTIPSERRLTCESRDIECREISERRFRDVAVEVSYVFASEPKLPQDAPDTPVIPLSRQETGVQQARKNASSWAFSKAVDSTADAQDFLSRCDDVGKSFFSALFDAQKAVSNRTKITWKHQSGFSLQFYFDRIGFAPLVWGFPAKNRDGKGSRERLDFPFDFSLKAGVPEAFINEFGASLSSLVPLLGGGKRPNISITALSSGDSIRIIETIFSFAAKASQK
jgi:Endonuclease NucS